jgi:hypothetical protein
MTGTTNNVLEVTDREMCVLLMRFLPKFRMGYRNPFPGRGVKEIFRELAAIAVSLQQKDLLGVPDNTTVSFWREALFTCAHPVKTVMLSSHFATASPSRRFVFIVESGAAEMQYPSPAKIRLEWIPSRKALSDRFAHELRMDTPLRSAGSTVWMKEDVLHRANSAFWKGAAEDGEAILREAQMGKGDFQRVRAALRNPASNSAVVCLEEIESSDPPAVRGFGVLEGGEDIWMLKNKTSDGSRCVEWTPSDGVRIREAWEALLGEGDTASAPAHGHMPFRTG